MDLLDRMFRPRSIAVIGASAKPGSLGDVLIGDPWHGRGIGALLLQRCLTIAREQGIETVWSLVLAENTQMLKLGRKLGFAIKRLPGQNELELRIYLRQPN